MMLTWLYGAPVVRFVDEHDRPVRMNVPASYWIRRTLVQFEDTLLSKVLFELHEPRVDQEP